MRGRYHPTANAGRRQTLGIMIPSRIEYPYNESVVHEMEQILANFACLSIFTSSLPISSARKIEKIFLHLPVSNYVVTPPPSSPPPLPACLSPSSYNPSSHPRLMTPHALITLSVYPANSVCPSALHANETHSGSRAFFPTVAA